MNKLIAAWHEIICDFSTFSLFTSGIANAYVHLVAANITGRRASW